MAQGCSACTFSVCVASALPTLLVAATSRCVAAPVYGTVKAAWICSVPPPSVRTVRISLPPTSRRTGALGGYPWPDTSTDCPGHAAYGARLIVGVYGTTPMLAVACLLPCSPLSRRVKAVFAPGGICKETDPSRFPWLSA